jgi:hypothetical protein
MKPGRLLLACQGQLRLASSGHVIGIDMDAVLNIGAARGFDLAVLRNCYRPRRLVWSRRCLAIEFGRWALIRPPHMSADCSLPAISEHMPHPESDPEPSSSRSNQEAWPNRPAR